MERATYCRMSVTSRKYASAALVGGASTLERLIWGMGSSLSQTAKNSRSFLLRDVIIPLPIISTMIPTCIDAPLHALSNDASGIIDVPEFSSFWSQKPWAVGSPNLTHNSAIATSVSRENGCSASLNGGLGDEIRSQIDGFAWCCGVLIDLRFHLMLSLSWWFRRAAFFTALPGRTRGLWWASPSLGRHSGRGQAEAGFSTTCGHF